MENLSEFGTLVIRNIFKEIKFMAQYSRSERRKKENAELSHTPIRKEEPRKPLPKARTSKKIARGAKKGFSALQKLVAIAAGLVTILGALGYFAITRNNSSKNNNNNTPSSSVVKNSSDSNQSSTDTQDSSSDANADQTQDGQSTDDQNSEQGTDGQASDSTAQSDQASDSAGATDKSQTGGDANQTPQQ